MAETTAKKKPKPKSGNHIVTVDVQRIQQADASWEEKVPPTSENPKEPAKRPAESPVQEDSTNKKLKTSTEGVTSDEPPAEDDLAKLLAEKKKALLASLGL
eukprot:gene4384-5393_t